MKRTGPSVLAIVLLGIAAMMRSPCKPHGVTFVALASEGNSTSVTTVSVESNDELVIPVGKGPGPVTLADVNHDGKLDILVANVESETLTVLLGDGKGHFVAVPSASVATGKAP